MPALVDGAFFAALTVALYLLRELVPVAGIVGDLFGPAPLIYVGVRHGLRVSFLATLVAAVVLAAVSPLFAGLFLCLFGLPALALGEAIRRGWGWGAATVLGAIVALAMTAPTYEMYRMWADGDPAAKLAQVYDRTVEQFIMQAEQSPDAATRQAAATIRAWKFLPLAASPALFAFGTLALTLLNLGAAVWLLTRLGWRPAQLPPLGHPRQWRCYDACLGGLALGGALLLNDRTQQPWLWVLGLNLALFFGLLYLLQGLAVVGHWFDRYRVHPLLRLAGIVLIVLQLPLLMATLLLGVADTWLDFRRPAGPQPPPRGGGGGTP